MRHGETDWNRSLIVQGQDDSSRLTLEGQAQAARVAATLFDEHFTLIVASDLRRTQETASIAAEVLGLEVVTTSLLRERDFGTLEGGPRSALEAKYTGIADDVIVDTAARPPGGESLDDMVQRSREFFELVERSWPQETLLVVTHGGTIRALLAVASGAPLLGAPWGGVDNCSLWRIDRP